ncbi:hypothetical protein [Streptomyces vietnamensis]|uniref:hypothetical protein n=1 Tax=Streptomyces vietnamensis TaxID=362257 RepID=UPI003F4D1910
MLGRWPWGIEPVAVVAPFTSPKRSPDIQSSHAWQISSPVRPTTFHHNTLRSTTGPALAAPQGLRDDAKP